MASFIKDNPRLVLAIKIGISASLLALILNVVPLEGVPAALSAAKWELVALGILVMTCAHYIKSVQLFVMTRHQKITLSPLKIFAITLITRFYGLFLPGVLAGGAIRWYHFARADNKPAQALAVIILNRVLETSMLICLGLCFWFLDRSAAETVPAQFMVLLAVVSVTVYLVTFNRHVHTFMLQIAEIGLVPEWIRSKAAKVLGALSSYERLPTREHLVILAVAILYHVLGLLSLWLIASALELDVSLATLGWIRSFVAILLILPISIAGLGIREASFVGLLIPYGVATQDALTLSILVFAKGLVFAFFGGVVEARRVFSGRKEYAR